MIPRSLSATAAAAFEACPARWKAEFANRVPAPSSSAADLGTVCHATLEDFVAAGHEPQQKGKQPIIEGMYEKHYHDLMPDDSRKAEGMSMIRTWHERTDFINRVVLSTEKKESFDIPTSAGPIPFNYIWDRCDLLEGPWSHNGEMRIEVIDYKTISRPLSPDGLKDKIQARCYGLAAQLKYPEADKIWVTFDLLRYDPVGVVFTKDENRATWRYLKKLAERVIELEESDPFPERLNNECHWCIRRLSCESLQANVAVGGIMSLGDPKEVAAKRHKLAQQAKALDKLVQELDDYLIDWAEKEDVLEWATDDLRVVVTARKTRAIDSSRAAEVLTPDQLKKYGSVGVTTVDRMIKEGALTPAQKANLIDLMSNKFGEPKIATFDKNPIDTGI